MKYSELMKWDEEMHKRVGLNIPPKGTTKPSSRPDKTIEVTFVKSKRMKDGGRSDSIVELSLPHSGQNVNKSVVNQNLTQGKMIQPLKIIGVLIFIIAIGSVFFGIFLFFVEGIDQLDELFGLLFIFGTSSSVIYYTLKTKFGGSHPSLQQIELENQLIKKQIEQKELLEKLNNNSAKAN